MSAVNVSARRLPVTSSIRSAPTLGRERATISAQRRIGRWKDVVS
jgi:hypothetical protein